VSIVLAIAVALTFPLAVILLSGRRMETSRAIRLHLPSDMVWAGVRDFGALHARHARGQPWLRIESSVLVEGDGRTAPSVWFQRGRWHDQPYWAEIELVTIEPPRCVAVRLRRDSLGTQRGLRKHRCELRLVSEGDRESKLVLIVAARFSGVRLPSLRRLAPDRLRPRLLDLSMRSVKHAVGAAEVTTAGPARGTGRPAGPQPPDDLHAPPPSPPPPMGDRV
jgi:hypothetical protein